MNERLLFRNGVLFDRSGARTADLLVEDGRIVAEGQSLEAGDVETVDLGGDLVIPGLINAHTHSNQAIERGLCDALPLDAWMVIASYGGAGARLEPRDIYVSTMVGAIEMLRTGTTSVLDCARVDREWFADGMDAVMQAYEDIGMRANVAAQYSDLDFFSSIPVHLVEGGVERRQPPRAAPAAVLEDVEAYLGRWKSRSTRLQPMLGPSSMFRCSAELFRASIEVARHHGVRFQTHLLSARSQVEMARERFGTTTVEFLADAGALEEWTSFAHAIWLDPTEIDRFAASDAVAVHNPVSNLKLGAGVAPVPQLLRAGATVALGSDGASSNDSQNMFETMKMGALVHRIAAPEDLWPTASNALEMCWDGGRRALGTEVGSLEPGACADLTVLRRERFETGHDAQLANQLVYGELGGSVRSVYVDGRCVLQDGDIVSVDAGAIADEARELVRRLWETLPDRVRRFEEVAGMLASVEGAVGERPLGFARSFCG